MASAKDLVVALNAKGEEAAVAGKRCEAFACFDQAIALLQNETFPYDLVARSIVNYCALRLFPVALEGPEAERFQRDDWKHMDALLTKALDAPIEPQTGCCSQPCTWPGDLWKLRLLFCQGLCAQHMKATERAQEVFCEGKRLATSAACLATPAPPSLLELFGVKPLKEPAVWETYLAASMAPHTDLPPQSCSTGDTLASQQPALGMTTSQCQHRRRTPKDWAALEKAIDKELEEDAANEENLETLLQKIYQNADDDTRRAMLKSYQASGGTVLSTNWDDVKQKDYSKTS